VIEEFTMNNSNSRPHFFDLKIPLGGLLTFYGSVLLLYGIFGSHAIYAMSFGINVNLIWGIVMILAGGGFLGFSYIRNRR
jgi:hypothetical protein